MPTEVFSGTATIGSTPFSLPNASTTLTPRTEQGTYEARIDFSNMTIADRYQVEVLEKVTSGGGQRSEYKAVVQGASAPVLRLVPSVYMHGWDIVVTKLAGTDRSISWSIRKPD